MFGDEGPDLLEIDSGEEFLVSLKMEVSLTLLTEVAWMELLEEDSVMVEASSLSSTCWMLSVLSNSTVSEGHMSSHLPSLLQSCHLNTVNPTQVLPFLIIRVYLIKPSSASTLL